MSESECESEENSSRASNRYGYEQIIKFIKSYDFVSAFGKPENEIWQEWIIFIKEYYTD
jgi:hypothetical protein